MIDRRFFNFKKYDTFILEKSNIPNDAIVFIKDKLCIWTHGTEYVCNGIKDSVLDQNSLEFKDSTGNTAFSISMESGTITLTDSEGNSLQEQYVLKLDFDSLLQLLSAIQDIQAAHQSDVLTIHNNINDEIQYRQNADLLIHEKIDNMYSKNQIDVLLSLKLNTVNAPTKLSDLTNDVGYLTLHLDISEKANTADLANIAFTGSYNDLHDIPLQPLGNYATEEWVGNKLNDILGIDAEGVLTLVSILSDNDTVTGLLSQIASKADKSQLFSGSFNDLTDKPSVIVPTNISAFNNDAGYLTEHLDISNKVDVLQLEQFSNDVTSALTILQRIIGEKYVLKKDVYSIMYSDWNGDDAEYIALKHFHVWNNTLYTTNDVLTPQNKVLLLTRDDFHVENKILYA